MFFRWLSNDTHAIWVRMALHCGSALADGADTILLGDNAARDVWQHLFYLRKTHPSFANNPLENANNPV